MKFKRVKQCFAGILAAVLILLTLSACAFSVLLWVGTANSQNGKSLQTLGYSVFLADESGFSGAFPPGAAVVVQRVAHEQLTVGDLVVCMELGTDGQYYPVTRLFSEFDENSPLSITVETLGDSEILTVNRDDVIGKCIFSSQLLGTILSFFRNSEGSFSLSLILFVGCLAVFFLCLINYLILTHRTKKQILAAWETKGDDLVMLVDEDGQTPSTGQLISGDVPIEPITLSPDELEQPPNNSNDKSLISGISVEQLHLSPEETEPLNPEKNNETGNEKNLPNNDEKMKAHL